MTQCSQPGGGKQNTLSSEIKLVMTSPPFIPHFRSSFRLLLIPCPDTFWNTFSELNHALKMPFKKTNPMWMKQTTFYGWCVLLLLWPVPQFISFTIYCAESISQPYKFKCTGPYSAKKDKTKKTPETWASMLFLYLKNQNMWKLNHRLLLNFYFAA